MRRRRDLGVCGVREAVRVVWQRPGRGKSRACLVWMSGPAWLEQASAGGQWGPGSGGP